MPAAGDALADDQLLTKIADELEAVLLLATKMMTDDREIARALDACEARISAAHDALEAQLDRE